MDRKIYVGNLDRDTTKDEVESLFAKFGELESCWIARNPAGFAFVVCVSPRRVILRSHPRQ